EKTTVVETVKTTPTPSEPAKGGATVATTAAVSSSSAPTPAPSSSSSAPPPATPPASSPTSDARSSPKPPSEIAQKAEQGLMPFLIASALGGLFALVMPCVWPMVPITVNFFVKQGQGKSGRGKATGLALAIIYCLSIIGVFTTVGVLFSFFFSA